MRERPLSASELGVEPSVEVKAEVEVTPERIPWLQTPVSERPPIADLDERKEILTDVARARELYPSLYKPGSTIAAIDVLNRMDKIYTDKPSQQTNTQINILVSERGRELLGKLDNLLGGGNGS